MLSSAVAVAMQVERAAGVDRARPDRVSGGAFDRTGLARQRRFVQDRVRRGHAVHRDHRALLHQEPIARAHVLDRALDQALVLVAGHGSRRAVEESRQLPVRTTIRVGLERLTRGEHQRDHGAREVLLQGERAAHREQGDHVDAGLSPQQPLDDVAEQRDESDERSSRSTRRSRRRACPAARGHRP